MLRQVPHLFQNPIRSLTGWDFVVLALSELDYLIVFQMFYFLQTDAQKWPRNRLKADR